MKANNNVEVLRAIIASGFGIECVSVAEVRATYVTAGLTSPRLALSPPVSHRYTNKDAHAYCSYGWWSERSYTCALSGDRVFLSC